jgi:hypothetical protein
MDPVSLANAATVFFVPHLTKIGGEVLENFGKMAWDLIMENFKDKPASASTAHEFASNADDPDNQVAFEAQLRKALKENPGFAKELDGLLKQAEKAGITNTDGAVATNGSTALKIGGDLKGNLVIGDGNSISQTFNKAENKPADKKNRKRK